MNDIFKNDLMPIFNIIKSNLLTIKSKIIQRERKLSVNDMLYKFCLQYGERKSYTDILSIFCLDNKNKVSKNAFLKKDNIFDVKYLEDLNKSILDIIYQKNKYRFVACDSTQILINNCYKKYDYSLCNNKHYYKGIISTLFDVEKKIPINYNLYKTTDERTALAEQFHFLKPNDVLILDRGYHSKDMIKIFNDKKIKFLMRVKKGCRFVDNFIKSKKCEDIINVNGYSTRLITYDVPNGKEKYYMATNILNEYDIPFFKDLYRQRWEVEINFKYSKYYLSLSDIHTKTEHTLKLNILTHQFITIISSYIEYLIFNKLIDENNKKLLDGNHKINTKSCINMTLRIIKIILYMKGKKKIHNSIIEILEHIETNIVYSKTGRHNIRSRKKPINKWRIGGTSSGRPHKTKNGIPHNKNIKKKS
jgi:hypothetical protein